MQNASGISILALVGLFVLGLAPSASAVDVLAKDCSSGDIHHYRDVPQDLGNGIILTHIGHKGYISKEEAWGATGVVLRDCKTGQFVSIRLSQENGGADGKSTFDHTQVFDDKMEKLKATNSSPVVLKDFEQLAELIGAPVKANGISELEACACQAFYPELRGEKTRYNG